MLIDGVVHDTSVYDPYVFFCLFNRGSTEGTNFFDNFVFHVCVRVLFRHTFVRKLIL